MDLCYNSTQMKKNMIAVIAVFGGAVSLASAAEDFTVDFSREVGELKRLNGVCNMTPLSNSQTKSIDGMVRKLEIPYYRVHDAALENPGMQLVDVRRIFPLLHADANDPANYDFRATDDYLKQAIDAGAKIEFRLGESIEHSPKKYLVTPPPDFEKWADVCCHIIRHYNEGWANGFKWNIQHWSIWEEPDTNPQLLTGAPNPFKDIYLPLYATAVRRIKKEFPHLKVGGPQGCHTRSMKLFVDYCAENKLPIDFYGFTAYRRSTEDYATIVNTIRKYLDEKGYADTELALVEWHLGPTSWSSWGTLASAQERKAWKDALVGLDSTAFTAAMLTHMQDTPLDRMYFYCMKSDSWGLFDGGRLPLGSYYSMLAFAQLAHGKVRVAAKTMPRTGFYLLATKEKENGRGHVLVSAFCARGEPGPLVLKGGVKPVSVKAIDSTHNFADLVDWRWDAAKETLSIPRPTGDRSGVWLVEVDSLTK